MIITYFCDFKKNINVDYVKIYLDYYIFGDLMTFIDNYLDASILILTQFTSGVGGITKQLGYSHDFYYNCILNNIQWMIKINNSEIGVVNYIHYPHIFESYIFTTPSFIVHSNYLFFIQILLKTRLFQTFSLCMIVLFMQKISRIFCSKEHHFAKLIDYIVSYSIFSNSYNSIIALTNWLYTYIYNLSHNKLYYEILFKLYSNIRGLIINFKMSYSLSINKSISRLKCFFLNKVKYVLPILTLWDRANLNIVYSVLSIVYVALGWLLDYLSYMWMSGNNSMHFRFIGSLRFWCRRFIYATIYIIWLFSGVISTNGIYFSILRKISNLNLFYIIITLLGSIVSYLFSSLWFYYGQASISISFDLIVFLINSSISFLLENNNTTILGLISQIWNLNYRSIFTPTIFNHYTSLRRSILEWIAFLGMVFSTYGTWSWYYIYVFNNLRFIYQLLIWIPLCLITSYITIYLEQFRPRFSNYYYGLFYLLFWTSICFFTNIIVGMCINPINAHVAIMYLIPLNFTIGIIYVLPLYRHNIDNSNLNGLLQLFLFILQLFLFILLTAITLVSAGTLWYLIY